jgi:REP-associated tyrosine transposase
MGKRYVFEAGASVHVIQRGINCCRIFLEDVDYWTFFRIVRRACSRYGIDFHTFTLMTNHVHLILTPHDAGALAGAMRQVGGRYVRYFNRKYERTGTLWNGPYRRWALTDANYLLTCMRYIEQNPVRAGIVAASGDYEWSSYRMLGMGEPMHGIVPHALYLALGSTDEERQAKYRALCSTPLSARDLAQLREP